jgi:CRISPR-associated protein Cas2
VYVILVYDIGEKRVQKVCKLLRRYLNWIQNSVFEGEITPAKLKEAENHLKRIIKKEEDSIIIYKLRTENAFKKEVIGQEKNPIDVFI